MPEEQFLLHRHPTLNPYLSGVNLILKRLRWDITLESWRSRYKLKRLKNRFVDQNAVIVCNGPSLLKSDLSLLKKTFSFGLNKINLLFDKSDFRPSCIVAANPFVIKQNANFFNQTEIPLFLDSEGTRFIRSGKNVTFFHSSNLPRFSRDCSMSLFQGFTVTYVSMQLAFHMGFKNVALVGCDHNYVTTGISNKIVVSREKDPDHFDQNYFSGGDKWQLPDLLGSELYYTLARDVYQQNRRRIFNATEGGKLEVFPRISLEDFIGTTSLQD